MRTRIATNTAPIPKPKYSNILGAKRLYAPICPSLSHKSTFFFGRGMGLNTNSPLPYTMCMSGTKLVQVQLNNTMLEAWIKNNPSN